MRWLTKAALEWQIERAGRLKDTKAVEQARFYNDMPRRKRRIVLSMMRRQQKVWCHLAEQGFPGHEHCRTEHPGDGQSGRVIKQTFHRGAHRPKSGSRPCE